MVASPPTKHIESKIFNELVVDFDSHLPALLSTLSNKIGLHALRACARKLNLDLREWRAIQVLGMYGKSTINEVVDRVAMDQGGTSRAIARMEDRGLLARESDATDRRRSLVELTKQGIKLHREIAQFALEREKHLLRRLSTSDCVKLKKILTILIQEADDMLNENWLPSR